MYALLAIVVLMVCQCTLQNSCDKWLESMDVEFPYLSVHNSYHIRTEYPFSIDNNYAVNVTTPRMAYTNPSLTTLLSNGVVGLEIDIHPSSANEDSGINTDSDAIHVFHEAGYDVLSTCNTLSDCLTEINEWYIQNKNSLNAPLFVYINHKDDGFTKDQQLRINSLWTDTFDANDLYTPLVHNGESTLQYADWSDVCYEDIKNKIIPVIDVRYHQNIDDVTELNMFALCKCQTEETYCVVLRDKCDDEALAMNDEYRFKYLYRSYTELTQHYPQWNQYPLIYNDTVPYGQQLLGFKIPNEVAHAIYGKYPEYEDAVTNILTVDQWQYWQTAAMIDSLGNNDGKWNADDLVNFFKIINPTQPALEFSIGVIFWQEGYEGWDILDPMLWAKVKCMWNGGYGLEPMVINVNLSETLMQICHQINKKYHYMFADYPFNWTYVQDFTIEEIKRKHLCENITVTTHIKQSTVTSDCLSKSEFMTTMYWIAAGFIALFVVFISFISVVVYCCVCYKKGGCKLWCNTHCCECCGSTNDSATTEEPQDDHELQSILTDQR
eukprot:244031_1